MSYCWIWSCRYSEGLDTFLAVKAAAPSTPIVLLTAVEDGDVAVEMLRRGAQDYLCKERIEACLLARVIRYAIARQRVDARVAEPTADLKTANEALQLQLSARKQAEEALRSSEERARQIVSAGLDAIVMMDSSGIITQWNLQAERIFGWSSEEAIGRKMVETIVPPRNREAHNEGLHRFLTTDESRLLDRRIELTALDRDGREFPVELTVSQLEVDGSSEFSGFIRDITERKQAHDALWASQANYQDLYDNAPDMYLSVEAKTAKIIDCNTTLLTTLGYSEEEVVGRSIYELYHPDCRDRARQHVFEQFRRTGAVRDEELQVLRKDGSVVDVSLSASAVRDAEGNTIRTRSTWRDITERKRMEHVARESEDHFRRIVDTTQEGIIQLDTRANLSFVNQRMADMLGYDLSEIQGRALFNFMDDDATREAKKRIKQHMEGKQSRFDFRFRRKDGSQLWAIVSVSPIFDDDGQYTGELGMVTDITDRKTAEQELRTSQENYRDLYSNAPIMYTSVDARTGNVVECNRKLLATLGYAEHEVLGRPIFHLVHPDSQQHVEQHVFPRFQRTGAVNGEELQLLRKDGSAIDVVLNASSVRDEEGNILRSRSIYQDVTDRKRAEEEVRTSREQLRALTLHREHDREEERAAIARDLHDELGQTLTALKMDIASSKRAVGPRGARVTAGLDSALELVDQAINSCRRITTRMRPGVLDYLGLVGAIEWQANEFSARSGIECGMQLASDDLDLNDGAVTALFRIFQETLTNVTRHAGASRVDIRLAAGDDTVELEVRDNGCGVREGDLQKSTSFGVLGIRERAQAFGGMAEISGVPDEGTTVRVRIPRSRP